MIRRPRGSTRTDPLLPNTTLFRSAAGSSVRESGVQPHLRPAPETPALAAREDPAATVREVEGELLQFAARKRCTGRQQPVVFERRDVARFMQEIGRAHV